MAFQIAVDVGGTFTDGVLLDDSNDRIWVAKSLTTSSDPGDGIARVIELLLAQKPPEGDAVNRVVHGTTLITNTLLERKGSKTALLVTRGTEDALDIRREMRYDTYDLAATFPEPLVDRDLRFAVDERLAPDGSVRRPLDAGSMEQVGAQLVARDVAAVAICFLHSCADGRHEREAATALRRIAPGLRYSLSSEVASEIGEYERMSTVVANAYVHPVVDNYLQMLGRRLKGLGIGGRLDIMVSHGGFTEAEVGSRYPIQLLESGPAGGVLSAINCGNGDGTDKIVAFDMGGTTAKSCVSIGGRPAITHIFEFARVRRFRKGSGLPAISPSIDLIEIGAGGGSIARLNALGLLQVGPDSVGSEPGPACYDLGGTQPTVTDADLLLGYLDAENFLGGKMKLNIERAHEALEALGHRLNLSPEATAWGIHDIVNENMAAAARAHIAESGHDARGFTLVATGGAGPVHAVDVARRLRIPRVLCPIASGVGSCLGFLAAPARADRSWSRLEKVSAFDSADFKSRLAAAKAEIVADLALAEVRADDIEWEATAEMRFLGQGACVEVKVGAANAETASPVSLLERFEREYTRLYGRTVPGGIAEIVTWRVSGQSSRVQRRYAFAPVTRPNSNGPIGKRRMYLPREKRFEEVPVYDRHLLDAGARFKAPAVIVEPESTLVIAHAARVMVLATGTVEVVFDVVPAPRPTTSHPPAELLAAKDHA